MTAGHKKPHHAGEENPLDAAVARALRDNLTPLQRMLEELQHAYSDLAASCASSRAANALPAMLRAQAAAASLSAGLGVLANFVTIALQPRDRSSSGVQAAAEMLAAAVAAEPEAVAETPHEVSAADAEEQAEMEEALVTDEIAATSAVEPVASTDGGAEPVAQVATEESAAPAFDVDALNAELQEMHRRARRVAKVGMQDIKMLRPKDVRLARENKDICVRLRDDLDKARKEYDRRFKAILDHPVDYFHDWLVAILAEGDQEALGEYPYPSPVVRH